MWLESWTLIEVRYWKGGWNCVIHRFMSSPVDVYVAVKGDRKSIRYSVGDKSKIFLWLRHRQDFFNAQMLRTVNTDLRRISDLWWEFSMFQHSKRTRWLQKIVKRWVMEVCAGLMWLMIRYRSGFCKLGKEASSSTTGRQNVQIFHRETGGLGFQS